VVQKFEKNFLVILHPKESRIICEIAVLLSQRRNAFAIRINDNKNIIINPEFCLLRYNILTASVA
jgi:hypothetical protein